MGKVICSKCRTVIEEVPNFEGESHGVCDGCFEAAKAEAEAVVAAKLAEREQQNQGGKR